VTSVADILEFLGARPEPVGVKDLEASIHGPGTIDAGGPGQIAFCSASAANALERARTTGAGLALLDAELAEELAGAQLPGTVVVRSECPRLDFARVVGRFFAAPAPAPGTHPSAVVAPGARVDPSASIGPLCSVADAVEIGAGCVLHAGVHLYSGVRLGRRVIVHSGTVIGADGFGYERDRAGVLVRIPHLGGVVIEDEVEIGANAAIDRGVIEDTWIGRGACIDNLVHIAHNARVGSAAVVIAHAMVAGSVKLGDRAWIAPAACLRDGIAVGDDAVVGLGAVVTRDVAPGETVLGNPARELTEHRRLQAAVRDLANRREA
jgi:UDP-3-O-[3-hydroxymyristoyl] glucosamine N-acyltransferase